jgi:AraC-like DNA-binding protein
VKHQHYTTHRDHADQRVESWSLLNQQYFGKLRVSCLDDGPLDAALDAYELGPLRLIRIQAPAHRVERDARCGELPTDEFYKLVLQLRGRAEICQDERRFVLQPGDWSLYDPRVPYAITNLERCSMLVTQVPRSRLRDFKVPNLHTSEAHSSNRAGLHAVFGSFMRSLAEQLPELPDGVGAAVSESIFGLLGSTLAAHQVRDGEAHATSAAVLKLRVKQYVHTHLADGELSIQRIADALRCSKRYLHRVFEDEDQTLDRFIWQMRLERCSEALRNAAGRRISVSEIAFAWGFNSSAHFCRAFKAQYEMSPREFQRREAERASASARLTH